ncbi:hypothetical protein Ais01nite_62070 [Asanoa ishikariensis]|uniref:Uncharacterized protein n=1 Tax=Asanoa ishikariensis TaxID=137265 RepID=A0A1H3P249_9ACTN|nr:hypothetical protein [Asanoa ishikariensis]GIF68172.1 hypothetical protein Ais01nite_62070 [Asanoa ishikariensis]SDY95177.1 hypothetical protein SAMN05421684_2521 [Asanoa ishikariensis]
MRGEEELTCSVCGTALPFGHPTDSPELMCEGCGAAVVVAPITVWLRYSRKGGVAPVQRSAA